MKSVSYLLSGSIPNVIFFFSRWMPIFLSEFAELLNLSPFTVRPRVTELYKQGKIERTDKRKNLSGAKAYVYKVSKQEINKLYTERGT